MCARQLRTFEDHSILMDLQEMPRDMKRMLQVQLKELIHSIEDVESEGRVQRHAGGFSGTQAA